MSLNDLVLATGFAFLLNLTDTEDRLEVVSESEFNLILEDSGSLVVVSTTLGVAKDSVVSSC